MTESNGFRIVESEVRRLRFDLGGARGGSGITEVQVILARLGCDNGLEGWGFSYVLRGTWRASLAAARDIGAALIGGVAPHPEAAWRRAFATFNRTGGGPNLIGLAAIDVALWDLWAKRFGLPLGAVLGGEAAPVPVYASGGFSAGQDPDAAAEIAAQAMAKGYAGVKPRLGGTVRDRAVLRAVRRVLQDDALLLADANEKLDLPRALAALNLGREYGVSYLEEPLPSHDLDGLRRLSREAGPTSIALGEHLMSCADAQPIMREGLAGMLQPDLAMIGGLTPALRLGRAAEMFGIALSPHFLPGLFVHLASACPNLIFLEEFPLLEPLFDGWPEISSGKIAPGLQPGHGLVPNANALAAFVTPD